MTFNNNSNNYSMHALFHVSILLGKWCYLWNIGETRKYQENLKKMSESILGLNLEVSRLETVRPFSGFDIMLRSKIMIPSDSDTFRSAEHVYRKSSC